MIRSIRFRNFKALRDARVELGACNLLIGPNGSGKTSLIQALLRLRTMARLPLKPPAPAGERRKDGPEITFACDPPFSGAQLLLSCVSEAQCDLLEVQGLAPDEWLRLREALLGIRAYLLDHYAIALPAPRHQNGPLVSNGGNLAARLALWQAEQPDAFGAYCAAVFRLLPEYDEMQLPSRDGGTVEIALRLRDGGEVVPAEALSQGVLYLLALVALAHDPEPPTLVCIEEVDRGVHPRLLRELRDLLYRLSHPESQGVRRSPVQVIVTTHSPYLLDLFREHPEEVIIAEREGRSARFARLVDRPDFRALAAEGGSLGDLWFAGLLGGVPEEK